MGSSTGQTDRSPTFLAARRTVVIGAATARVASPVGALLTPLLLLLAAGPFRVKPTDIGLCGWPGWETFGGFAESLVEAF
jgi:hypothetical protein